MAYYFRDEAGNYRARVACLACDPTDAVQGAPAIAAISARKSIVGVVGLLLYLFASVQAMAFQTDSRYVDDYPQAASIKGLQVEMLDDALALGVKHAALNVNLTQLIDLRVEDAGDAALQWTYEGEVYRFNAHRLARLDTQIKALSDEGVLVHLILLTYASGNTELDRRMLHPAYNVDSPNRLGAFNSTTELGRRYLTATMEFLAERWSRPDRRFGRVVGYIVGNEVNSHWWWCNMGRVTMVQFTEDYLQAVRLIHAAVRRQASWPRVYISLEHHWNIRYPAGDEQQAFPAKAFVDYFAQQARETSGGDFDWHIAFHPYPEDLFDPAFWKDKTAVHQPDTPRITFKNLEVLTQYLDRPELLFEGQPRHVILSEQGFHTPDGKRGETIQAAAYCAAYKKVESLTGIDAFILHRHVDHPREGGLRLGLRGYYPGESDPRPPKHIYDCFRLADTPDWENVFKFALPIIGIDAWNRLPPNSPTP